MILTFPDKTKREFPSGVTPAEVAAIIGQGLKKVALAAKVNGRLVDLDTPIQSDADIKIITYEDDEGKEIFWHSTAHIMASAILHLYPKAKLAIGPAIPNDFSARFYYDIDLPQPLTEDDLGAIEAEMSKIIAKDLPFKRLEIPIEKAIKKFNDEGDIYKAEMVSEFESETVSLYAHGDFIDMCRGPHIPSTGKVKAFKLLSVAGSYWRGDENKKMLWRIYGVSFPEKKMLKEHLEKLEQAKLCDHRILGKALDLFSINDDIGPGLVLWHPKGAIVRNIIENFWREEHLKNGYELVYSPHIAKINLWHKSGHL
ncbi:MAG: threonine--tRNA ligase, partial [Candidatus Zixiibacteriota bacterium]